MQVKFARNLAIQAHVWLNSLLGTMIILEACVLNLFMVDAWATQTDLTLFKSATKLAADSLQQHSNHIRR